MTSKIVPRLMDDPFVLVKQLHQAQAKRDWTGGYGLTWTTSQGFKANSDVDSGNSLASFR